jgi:hypothetical protein
MLIAESHDPQKEINTNLFSSAHEKEIKDRKQKNLMFRQALTYRTLY